MLIMHHMKTLKSIGALILISSFSGSKTELVQWRVTDEASDTICPTFDMPE